MTIDIHGHVTSPELLRRFPMPPALGDIAGMVEEKALAGITTTIVGSPVGAGTMVAMPGLDNYNQPADRLEAFHEWLAGTVREWPAALRAYVYTNPFGGEAMLSRAAERLAQDEFVGFLVNTSVRGRFLSDPAAEPFFAMAAERGAPVLLHAPAEPVGSSALGHIGLVEHVARPCDITMGVAAVLFAGLLKRYPALRLIATTAGGALPLLVEKLDLAWQRGATGARGSRAKRPSQGAAAPGRRGGRPAATPLSRALRQVYVDTASPSAVAVAAAARAFGADRMLFGTDSPPLTAPLAAALAIVDGLPLDEADKDRIRAGNARKLFGLDAVVTAGGAS